MRHTLVSGWLLLVVACDGGDANPIATYPYPSGGMFDQALNSGTLVREGDCLYMDNPGYARYFIAFADGAVAWRGGAIVTAAGTFREGDTVTFGGGEGFGNGMYTWVRPPDDSCDLANVWRASGALLEP